MNAKVSFNSIGRKKSEILTSKVTAHVQIRIKHRKYHDKKMILVVTETRLEAAQTATSPANPKPAKASQPSELLNYSMEKNISYTDNHIIIHQKIFITTFCSFL
jgi:hypothetical protein